MPPIQDLFLKTAGDQPVRTRNMAWSTRLPVVRENVLEARSHSAQQQSSQIEYSSETVLKLL
jgi:hypothetical protein